jgi:hypothetical protein
MITFTLRLVMILLGENIVSKNEDKKIDSSGTSSFEAVFQIDVPKGRDGKHKQIILRLLDDIEKLKPRMALKVPLSQLPDTKENIRSALSRAARQKEIDIATSSNDEFLYIWKTEDATA